MLNYGMLVSQRATMKTVAPVGCISLKIQEFCRDIEPMELEKGVNASVGGEDIMTKV